MDIETSLYFNFNISGRNHNIDSINNSMDKKEVKNKEITEGHCETENKGHEIK